MKECGLRGVVHGVVKLTRVKLDLVNWALRGLYWALS